MKYIVLSDSHGYINNAIDVLERFKDEAEGFIHLGDCCTDAEYLHSKFSHMRWYSVAGNNDYGGQAPAKAIAHIGGKKIVMVHGHKQRVSYGVMTLSYLGMEEGADAVLFGHTHRPFIEYEGNTALFNPGSISLPRSTDKPTFGIMNIGENIRFDIYMYDPNAVDKFIKIY